MKNNISRLIIFFIIFALCVSITGVSYGEGNKSGALSRGQELHAFYPSKISLTPNVMKYIDSVDSISCAWSQLDGDNPDMLNSKEDQKGNIGFYYPDDFKSVLQYAKSKGKSIQISIFSDSSNAVKILTNEDFRKRTIATIINTLKTDMGDGAGLCFDGVVIDFEELRDTNYDGSQILYGNQPISTYYNSFFSELKPELSKLGKKLYIAVNTRLYYDGYDYAEIIKYADRLIIMAHDYEPTPALTKSEVSQYMDCSVLNPVDSMAPIQRIKSALLDVRKRIPDEKDLKKVWLQVAFDCAQWQFQTTDKDTWEKLDGSTLSDSGRTVPTYGMIKDRIDNIDGKGVAITYGYNNELQTPYINYYNTVDKTYNIILYENRLSVIAKMNVARSFGLGGVSVWSLGNVPDYSDKKGKTFGLDVWDGILTSINQTGSTNSAVVKFTNKKIEDAVRSYTGKYWGSILKSDADSVYRLQFSKDVGNLSDLKYLTNLEYLDLQKLNISNITALSSLKNLKTLYLQRNLIADIKPLKSLTKLQVLSLNGNRVTDLKALSGLTSLKELYLIENKITDLTPIGSLGNLSALYLDKNNIKNISAIGKLKKLTQLSLDENSISGISPISGLISLKYLSLGINKIDSIQAVKGMKALQTLYLQRNLIADINPLSQLTALQMLSLNGNRVVDLKPLSRLTALKNLYLRDNKIKDITPLAGLINLEILYLGGNSIKDFSPINTCYNNLKEKDF